MVDTIQEALNSVYLVAFLFGFGILRYPLDYPRVRLSIIYILSLWSVYACVFYYVLIYTVNYVTSFMIHFTIIINLFITTIFIIITIRKHKKFNILINKLNQIDNTLEELGTSKEYHKLRNSIKLILIMWFIFICTTLTIDSLCIIDMTNDSNTFIIPITTNYSFYINILVNIIFIYLLRYVGTRYDKINDHIRQMSETKEYGLRSKKSFLVSRHCIHNTENRKRILWTVMHLHSQLCRIAFDINNLFEMQMTMQTMSYFVILTTTFYFQYHMLLCLIYTGYAVSWKCLLTTYMWCITDTIRLVSLNYICESVSAKAQKTKSIILKLTNLICFANAREEICQFILQLLLRPLKFTGMGLFYFGYKFLCKFFVSIFSVIVIVIQMDTSVSQIVLSRNNVTCKLTEQKRNAD